MSEDLLKRYYNVPREPARYQPPASLQLLTHKASEHSSTLTLPTTCSFIAANKALQLQSRSWSSDMDHLTGSDDLSEHHLRAKALQVMTNSFQTFFNNNTASELINNPICQIFLNPTTEIHVSTENSQITNLTNKDLLDLVFLLITSNLTAHCSLLPDNNEADEEAERIQRLVKILHEIKSYSSDDTFLETITPVLEYFETNLTELMQAISENFIDVQFLELLITTFEIRFTDKNLPKLNGSLSFGYCNLCCNDDQVLLTRNCCSTVHCLPCAQKWVCTKILARQTRVSCPGCTILYQKEEILLLMAHQADKFHQIMTDLGLNHTDDKTCPNCASVTKNPLQTNKELDSPVVKCKACSYYWCFNCHGPKHDLWSCSENKDSDFLLEQWSQQRLVGGRMLRARRCPNPSKRCRAMIEKNEGCNHMTCTNCLYEFCYLCGGRWSDLCPCDMYTTHPDYDSFLWTSHYQEQELGTRTSRRLFLNSQILDNEDEESVKLTDAYQSLRQRIEQLRQQRPNKLTRLLQTVNKYFCCKL